MLISLVLPDRTIIGFRNRMEDMRNKKLGAKATTPVAPAAPAPAPAPKPVPAPKLVQVAAPAPAPATEDRESYDDYAVE